jgi:hypothetical protein
VKVWIAMRRRSVFMIAIILHAYVTKRIVKVIILITSSFGRLVYDMQFTASCKHYGTVDDTGRLQEC